MQCLHWAIFLDLLLVQSSRKGPARLREATCRSSTSLQLAPSQDLSNCCIPARQKAFAKRSRLAPGASRLDICRAEGLKGYIGTWKLRVVTADLKMKLESQGLTWLQASATQAPACLPVARRLASRTAVQPMPQMPRLCCKASRLKALA